MAEDVIAREGVTSSIGVPPGRNDILTELTGLRVGEAWPERTVGRFGSLEVDVIGRAAFIRNKRATGRTTDLADVEGRA